MDTQDLETTEVTNLEPALADYSALIADQVAQRQAINETGAKTAKTASLLSFATTEPVYLLTINVSVGTTTAKLPWSALNLSPELQSSLNAAGAKAASVVVFAGLKDRGTQLKTRKETLQGRLLQCGGGVWFCREQDLPALADGIADLKAFADELRGELADCYDAEFSAYLSRIAAVLKAANFPPDAAGSILAQFAPIFPTLAAAMEGFGITFDGPYRVPSLLEQAQADNAVASELLKSEELAALKALQEDNANLIRSAVAEAVESTTDTLYGIIREELERLGKINGNALSGRGLKKALANLEIMERKLDFNSSLADVVSQIGDATTAARNGERDKLQALLADIKTRLGANIDEIQNSPKAGHRKLAQFMLG